MQFVQSEWSESRKFKQTLKISETNYQHLEEVKHPGPGTVFALILNFV